MKKLFSALAACAAVALSLSASAATLTQNFAASNGQVFSIGNEVSVSQDRAGYVTVKNLNGTSYDYPDASGALFNKVLAMPGFAASHVQVPGSTRQMNTQTAFQIQCVGSQTYFSYVAAQAEAFNDGCTLWQAVKAVSN